MPDLRRVPEHMGFAFPSACVTCGHPAGTIPMLDLVQELPGYGHLYLCEVCVHACGRELGMLAPLDAEKLGETARGLEAQVAELRSERDRSRDVKMVSEKGLRAVVGDVIAEQMGRLVPSPPVPAEAPAAPVAVGKRRHGRR